MSNKSPKPGQGQGALFEAPTSEPIRPEAIDTESYVVDLPAPATSLADYYATLHAAVVAIGDARSRSIGFAKLQETSKPVKEYSDRMDTDGATAQQVVVKSAKNPLFKAQDILHKRSEIEYKQLVRFGRSTGAFTIEEINAQLALPPSVHEVEFKYFSNPNKTPKELLAKRTQLARRAKKYGKIATDQVA